ncbi:hypothetical protein NDN01_18230 [Sphingomonas sp. QA11]|uniref:hypothetical protein n=1 Tax=Sphingomonas sp. QA11 TaxID=2950605 RepID=UPI00234A0F70|nr:hypothetical protein [Sphingomonas sp. QA11]WCM25949.1 hypothetical protein NDN01_18230 [Sphingomonas sp. QA11]
MFGATSVAAQDLPAVAPGTDIVVTGSRPQSNCPVPDEKARVVSPPKPGGGPDLSCLNRELQTAAKSGQVAPSAAGDTTSRANVPSKVGTFSFSATAQRVGRNFGKSATPYRPPAPVFTSPVMPGPRPR